MLLYWGILCKKIWQKDRRRGCRSRYWGVKCGEGILFEDRTKGLLAQAIFFALLSIFIYTGKGYDSELFRIFFGSQAD